MSARTAGREFDVPSFSSRHDYDDSGSDLRFKGNATGLGAAQEIEIGVGSSQIAILEVV